MNGDYSIVDVKLGAERLKHIKDINITDISNKSYELMRSTYSWDVLQDKWEELLS